MTYKLIRERGVSLAWFEPSISTTPTIGDYFTLTVGALNDLGITGSGSSTLSLPPGNYHLRACLGGNRSVADSTPDDFIDYQWELGGTLVGNTAGWDKWKSSSRERVSCEIAEVAFTITEATNIRIKCVDANGTCTLSSTYSGVIVRGVQ